MAQGGFLDLATTGEVQLVSRLGVDPSRCIHTHPIKRDKDIRNALAAGVTTFVADNPDEVRKFRRYRDQAKLLLRVSYRSPGAVADLSRKFGCDPEGALDLARLAARLGIDVIGFSFHVGSQSPDPLKHVEAIESCAVLLRQARREKLKADAKAEGGDAKKAWKDIWGCGQGIGAIDKVQPAGALVARLKAEYLAARARLLA